MAELRRDWRYRFWEVALWLPLTLQSWYLRMKYLKSAPELATAGTSDIIVGGSGDPLQLYDLVKRMASTKKRFWSGQSC